MDIHGLSTIEALARLEKNGKNEIRRTRKISPWKIFWSQFLSPLTLILVFAAGSSWLIGFFPGQTPHYLDSILILSIVVLSGVAGFFQEYRAEKSIEALQKLSTPETRVVRDNEVVSLPVTDIVHGDVVLVEAGDIIPADMVLFESFGLEIDESILTGESDAIKKAAGDEVMMGTSIYVGSAKGRVQKTGMQTKIGRIADKLQAIEKKKTSFEEEIKIFGRKIFVVAGVMTSVVFIGNLFKHDLYTSFLASISLAVAAIPEGLPAVVVLALAIGARAMYKNQALIRKLGVVESIGAIDIICTDKTGTITKNEMSVVSLFYDDQVIDYETIDLSEKLKKEVRPLILCSLICNNTILKPHQVGEQQYLGEQTEIGLVRAGEKIGFIYEGIQKEYGRIDEIPFSSDRKMMSVVVGKKERGVDRIYMYSKGAPEVLISRCDRIFQNRRIKRLNKEDRERIITQNIDFALGSLRVLGFAYKEIKEGEKESEDGLVWLGLEAMADPPQAEVAEMLSDCQSAGIRVIMITGDNPITAQAIAKKVGLKSQGYLLGKDVDELNQKELEEKLASGVNIFARTSPFHKQQILKVLERNYRVAMTGDGVNDALALKQASVGIAMGKRGTTVAKESSDIVILDDNFSTIVLAIKEGRRIFSNIRKFVNYLLVTNISEVMVIFISTLFFVLEKPVLMPAQILWINLLTDGLPALALGVDPAGPGIMKKPPRQKQAHLIDGKLWWLISLTGAKKTLFLLLAFWALLPLGEEAARSALFTGFILYEFVIIASIRAREKLGWFSNLWLIGSLGISLSLQLLVLYTPLNKIFYVQGLGWTEWGILIVTTVLGYFAAIQITKAVDRRL